LDTSRHLRDTSKPYQYHHSLASYASPLFNRAPSPPERAAKATHGRRQSAALRSCAVAAGALLWIRRAAPREEEPRAPVRGARAIVAGINGHRERERERQSAGWEVGEEDRPASVRGLWN